MILIKMKSFKEIIGSLNELLFAKQPAKISSSWISENAPHIYRFIWKNVRNEVGDIDWDKIVSNLDKDFQKRWACKHSRTKRQWQALKWYRSRKEVNLVLKKYKDKIYTFLSPQDHEDRRIRDAISIALVRISQKGNLSAKHEIISLLKYTADYWIECFPSLSSWKGYESELNDQLETCIRRYRFTGSFTTYLFCSLEYRGRGLRPLYLFSLDDQMPLGEKRRVENVVQDPKTNEIRLYKPY
jgi:hypothetical protein